MCNIVVPGNSEFIRVLINQAERKESWYARWNCRLKNGKGRFEATCQLFGTPRNSEGTGIRTKRSKKIGCTARASTSSNLCVTAVSFQRDGVNFRETVDFTNGLLKVAGEKAIQNFVRVCTSNTTHTNHCPPTIFSDKKVEPVYSAAAVLRDKEMRQALETFMSSSKNSRRGSVERA